MSIEEINNHIQNNLVLENLEKVSAVDAAKWLDVVGLLPDSKSRPGKPLRSRLRGGSIVGAYQQANNRWFIYRK